MTWEDFLDNKVEEDFTGQVQTDIDCPKCGRKIYLDTRVVLTSYPAKYSYWCSCGWNDFAPFRIDKNKLIIDVHIGGDEDD